jgi:RNA polymerase sigma-70 factor (sigma-E family)
VDLLGRDRARAEFERFVARHGEQLLRTGYLFTGDLAEAEDLTQECLLRVARRWPRVRGMAHPEAYARRVLVNLSLDTARRRTRRRRELAMTDGTPLELQRRGQVAANSTHPEHHHELLDALGTLPERQRLTLVLRYFADLSEAQTAEALGCSLGTVKSATARGLARLREALDPATADLRQPPATTRNVDVKQANPLIGNTRRQIS